MADIELVIKIDEKLYETSKTLPAYMCGAYQRAIINGKPLPKKYGRLIDISEYENNYFNVSISYDDGNHIHEIYTKEIPSIIETNKEWNKKGATLFYLFAGRACASRPFLCNLYNFG